MPALAGPSVEAPKGAGGQLTGAGSRRRGAGQPPPSLSAAAGAVGGAQLLIMHRQRVNSAGGGGGGGRWKTVVEARAVDGGGLLWREERVSGVALGARRDMLQLLGGGGGGAVPSAVPGGEGLVGLMRGGVDAPISSPGRQHGAGPPGERALSAHANHSPAAGGGGGGTEGRGLLLVTVVECKGLRRAGGMGHTPGAEPIPSGGYAIIVSARACACVSWVH